MLLTKSNTFIIGPIATVLGVIMNAIFDFCNGVFGIQNIGLCIILFTVLIYVLMIPMTVKQQKFSKLSGDINIFSVGVYRTATVGLSTRYRVGMPALYAVGTLAPYAVDTPT